jgi:hypothetical protein
VCARMCKCTCLCVCMHALNTFALMHMCACACVCAWVCLPVRVWRGPSTAAGRGALGPYAYAYLCGCACVCLCMWLYSCFECMRVCTHACMCACVFEFVGQGTDNGLLLLLRVCLCDLMQPKNLTPSPELIQNLSFSEKACIIACDFVHSKPKTLVALT